MDLQARMKAEIWAVGVLSFAIYLALAPYAGQVWLRTGDEPHYLLAAHSLAYDGDLDLRNNYDDRDYAAFYTSADLDRHVFTGPDGSQALTHNLGISILIFPAYRLGGYRGVLVFLAGIGALLSANVYALSRRLTGNWVAALAGWFVASLSPPVVWYVFLIYPEIVGALCAVLAVRVLIETQLLQIGVRHTIQPANALVLGVALAAMPWLSARYIPMLSVLFLATAVLAWRIRSRGLAAACLIAVLGAASFIVFNSVTYGSFSAVASYAGPRPLGLDYFGTRLLRGLMGWLMDQQRGLLLFSPVYLVAFIGLALWNKSLSVNVVSRRGILESEVSRLRPATEVIGLGSRILSQLLSPVTLVAVPFLAALLSTSAWGGFWMGYELGGRFIVAGIPLLAVGAAWTVSRLRPAPVLLAGLPLLVFSLWAGFVVFRDPLTGYRSTVFEYLSEEQNWDLRNWLPSFGTYALVRPGGEGATAKEVAPARWEAPATEGFVIRNDRVRDLAFGWYTLRFRAAVPALPRAGTPVISLLISQADETPLLTALLRAEDFPSDGSGRDYQFRFHNPEYNQWEKPPRIWVSSSGAAPLELSWLEVVPEGFHSWGLGLIWLAGFGFVGATITVAGRPDAGFRVTDLPARFWQWAAFGGCVVCLLLLARLNKPLAREYRMTELVSHAGREVEDPNASEGLALMASPEHDERGKLAFTRPELYPPGTYRMTVWLNAGPAEEDGEEPFSGLQVFGSRTPSVASLPVWPGEIPVDERYHPVVLDFVNPIEQFLTLQVNYTAVSTVSGDRMRIEPVP